MKAKMIYFVTRVRSHMYVFMSSSYDVKNVKRVQIQREIMC